MKIHKEGHRVIIYVFLITALLLAAIIRLIDIPLWFEFLLYACGATIVVLTALFFRVPVRGADYAGDKIFSGADGKVVAIEEVFEDEYFNDKRIQVSVFMSVFDVHVNYAPLKGLVRYFKHHPGKFLVAWHPKSSTENERTVLVVENPLAGKVLIRQIAGAVARRIVCYPRVGSQVEQGSEIGIIKFGSRVDLLLPLHAQVKVNLNQQVRGGETIIAMIR